MIKTKIAQIAISVFMIILVISSYFLVRNFLEHKESNDSSIELIEKVITEEKTEKFSFLYCEFYSEQKILQKSSIVRKSIRKKQKVLREIFSAAKIAQKKRIVIIYI